jgi:hypothetical protein
MPKWREGDGRTSAAAAVVVRAGHTLQETGIDVGSMSYGNTFAFMLAGVGVMRGIENEKVKDVLNLAENPSRQLVLLGDTWRCCTRSRGSRVRMIC